MKLLKDVSSKKLRDFAYEFVSPASSKSTSSTYDHQNRKESNAVVFLIGWTGCKDRHLSKYSSFYEEKGFSILRYSPSSNLMFGFDPEKDLTRHAQKLLQILKENELESLPIWFHLFSNGGAVIYYLLSKELQKPENQGIRIAGTIFDSSPALMTNRTTLNAISSIIPGNAVKKYSLGAAAIGFLWFSYGVNKFRDIFTGNETEDYRLWVYFTLKRQPNLSPQLFLYSRGDKIADSKSIDKFIEVRKKCGVHTNSKIWEDSDHVCHFKKYPQEYEEKLNEFLNQCDIGGSNDDNGPVLGKFGSTVKLERIGFQEIEDAVQVSN